MKTAEWLVEYCKAQVGRFYWYGCFGTKSSEKLLAEKKAQYPSYYKAKDYQQQMGVKVHDCAGLIKGALWSKTTDDPAPKYNSKEDFGATGFYDKAKVKGSSKTFPGTIGVLVFKGTATKKTHVGVYIGNDRVIEAKGHAYGVINSKYTGGRWTYWAECHLIDYKAEPTPEPTPTPTPAPTTQKYKIKTKTGVPLRLRAAPNVKSAVLALIPNGKVITVTDTQDGWAKTCYGGHNGWCSMTYLKKV